MWDCFQVEKHNQKKKTTTIKKKQPQAIPTQPKPHGD